MVRPQTIAGAMETFRPGIQAAQIGALTELRGSEKGKTIQPLLIHAGEVESSSASNDCDARRVCPQGTTRCFKNGLDVWSTGTAGDLLLNGDALRWHLMTGSFGAVPDTNTSPAALTA